MDRKLFPVLLMIVVMVVCSFNYSSGQQAELDSEELESYTLEQLLAIPVVFTAAMREQEMSKAPSIVSVITELEIRNMGARNFEDILRTIPGFDVIHFNTHIDIQIGIRGLSSSSDNNKVKIMINGHSLRSFNGAPAFYFNFIPIDNIKQIEIIRGPGSALYGTNAFLGIINIITKDELDTTAKVNLKAGSFNTYKPTLELFYKKNSLKTYFYADYYKTDGPKLDIESDRATQLFGPDYSAAPGKTAANAEFTSFFFTASYKDLSFQSFFHRQFDTNTNIGLSKALTDETKINTQAYFGELKYHLQASEKSNFVIKAYYDNHRYDALYEIFSEETASLFSQIYPDTPYPEGMGIHSGPVGVYSILGGEISLDYKIASSITLLGGTLYEHIKWGDLKHVLNGNVTGSPLVLDGVTYGNMQYVGGFRDVTDEANWSTAAERNITALYLQGIIDVKDLMSLNAIGESLILTTGLRYDDYDDVGDTYNPRVGLVYDPTKKINLKMLYGTAFRAPSFRELYNLNNPSFIGNTDIKPEKITTFEFFSGYTFNKQLSGGLTFFDCKIEDNLEIVDIVHENIGKVHSRGIETEFKYHYNVHKYGYLNFTYQDVTDTTHETISSPLGTSYTQDNFNPGSIPSLIGNIGINYDLTKNIETNFAINYIGPRKRSEEKTFDENGNLIQVDQRDDIDSLVLGTLSFTLGNFDFFKNFECQLSVYNIFDQDHRDPDASASLENDVPRPGRNFYARISYFF
ncbi:TonB-dependent receptor [bacterium]|nr:TonB-dependent receptor [bacterium]